MVESDELRTYNSLSSWGYNGEGLNLGEKRLAKVVLFYGPDHKPCKFEKEFVVTP
jgi:hypothetical protein